MLSFPPGIPAAYLSYDPVPHLNYAWSQGFDCVTSYIVMDPSAVGAAAFMLPSQTFGFVAISPVPAVVSVPLAQRLWAWTKPFTRSAWATLAGSLGATALGMWFLEAAINRDNFCGAPAGQPRSRALELGRSLYNACVTFTTQNADVRAAPPATRRAERGRPTRAGVLPPRRRR